MKNLFKLNKTGQYTPFPGVTIISAIDPKQQDTWNRVHATLSACEPALPYYSPLPFQSYHMTAINLFVEAQHPIKSTSSWRGFLSRKRDFFRQLNDFCKQNQFDPKIEIIGIEVSASIRLNVFIPEQQRNLIYTFARRFNLTTRLPDSFHVTLAYNYRLCSESQQQDIQSQLNERLLPIFGASDQLRLLSPALNYFKDMTEFVPWDGQSDPFLIERPVSPRLDSSAVFFRTFAEALDTEGSNEDLKPGGY